MEMTLSGITMLDRPQTENACTPMEITLSGIVMLVSLLHHSNAPLPNPVRTPYKIAA